MRTYISTSIRSQVDYNKKKQFGESLSSRGGGELPGFPLLRLEIL